MLVPKSVARRGSIGSMTRIEMPLFPLARASRKIASRMVCNPLPAAPGHSVHGRPGVAVPPGGGFCQRNSLTWPLRVQCSLPATAPGVDCCMQSSGVRLRSLSIFRNPEPARGKFRGHSVYSAFLKGALPMADNWRSKLITQGVARSPNRAMLRAVGFTDSDFDKAIVGVANGHSTLNPCNAGIQPLVDRTIDALKVAGAMPQVFGFPTVTDGIGMGTEGMKYSLVSREVIADSIETAVNGQLMDGVLGAGGCDKKM